MLFDLNRLFACFVLVIRCQGEFNDVVGCHSPLRSLCEISYTCGSVGRPVICECVELFGYPEPPPVLRNTTTISFSQACADARAARDSVSNGEL